jgi:ADP-glucose pyrophosphorylase
MSAPKILSMVLAGGEGRRLEPLTRDRAKPAVPFGGRYRIIDFVLSNLVNSGFVRIKILTQYKSESLNSHLSRAWHLSNVLGNFIEAVPAQMVRAVQVKTDKVLKLEGQEVQAMLGQVVRVVQLGAT